MRYGNPFSASNRNVMGSNAWTDQNQGGGSKKAGLAPRVGLDSWGKIYYNERGLTNTLVFTQTAPYRVPLYSNSNLPIGTLPTIHRR